ncbi:MAG: LUD domain-containing protein [Hyphomicrobiales bacterium]|nr:LUD domain-containing protein [Hyphomicrobiales bacterium]
MSARDEILTSIRHSLGVTGQEAPRQRAVSDRLSGHPAGVSIARGQLPVRERLDLFAAQAESVQATVSRVARPDDVPAEVAAYLRARNLPASLRHGADSRLAAMPWQATLLEVSDGPSRGDDINAVSYGFAGIAETGTMIMLSGPDNPTTLNFLPDNHIVVINAGDIVPDHEAVWERIRSKFGANQMPRTLNMITGPSRSGDIEQTMLLGAHGPRALHIILVDPDYVAKAPQ